MPICATEFCGRISNVLIRINTNIIWLLALNYLYPPSVFKQVAPFWQPRSVPAKLAHSFTSSVQTVPIQLSVHLHANLSYISMQVPPFLHGAFTQLSSLNLVRTPPTRFSSACIRCRIVCSRMRNGVAPPNKVFVWFSNSLIRWSRPPAPMILPRNADNDVWMSCNRMVTPTTLPISVPFSNNRCTFTPLMRKHPVPFKRNDMLRSAPDSMIKFPLSDINWGLRKKNYVSEYEMCLIWTLDSLGFWCSVCIIQENKKQQQN